MTMLSLAKSLLEPFAEITRLEYFCFANYKTERANVFSCLEVRNKDDYREELFYLRNCYNDGFSYNDENENNEE